MPFFSNAIEFDSPCYSALKSAIYVKENHHSVMNKITGFLLFILPLTLRVHNLNYNGAVVCAVATLAAVQEGYFIRTGIMKG